MSRIVHFDNQLFWLASKSHKETFLKHWLIGSDRVTSYHNYFHFENLPPSSGTRPFDVLENLKSMKIIVFI